jgi:hypothetical protein
MKSLSVIASIALLVSSVIAQEGATVPTGNTGAAAATYSCDPNTCKIANNCQCASTSAPGGLAPADTPQVKITQCISITIIYSLYLL